MKVVHAYSLDCEDIVDVEKAYDLYWANIIKDPKNFECISVNCSAEITCANIYKLRK